MSDQRGKQLAPVNGISELSNLFSAQKEQQINFYSLNLLLFSIGGVHFAIDADQAAGMTPYDGEVADDLFWFHEELDFGAASITYHSPTIVTIRTLDARPYRVIIDSMEHIGEFSLDDITPFPTLLEPFSLRMGMWGILVRNERVVLLLDLLRLLKERSLKPDRPE
jgi:chemotaxis signal transduction protein